MFGFFYFQSIEVGLKTSITKKNSSNSNHGIASFHLPATVFRTNNETRIQVKSGEEKLNMAQIQHNYLASFEDKESIYKNVRINATVMREKLIKYLVEEKE